eukprot:scaffold732_cov239-Chaetoceros_neogracile.AAC.2
MNKENTTRIIASISKENTKIIEEVNQPCALLFFGLVKHFHDIALPAIQRNIVGPNKHCDIYLHTYNITESKVNPRNGEWVAARLKPAEAFLLTDNVTMDTIQEFMIQRGEFLNHTRKQNFANWGGCCTSHDNMIQQWHSIQGVWNLMIQSEEQILSKKAPGIDVHGPYYQQIGLFRTDTYQVTPVDIFDSDAALPNFAHYTGYNDRMFYGTRQNAAIWADRFAFSNIFETIYNPKEIQHHGYHSETYLKYLMKHYKVPVELKLICMWRIRTRGRLQGQDCLDLKRHTLSPNMLEDAPPGYVVDGVYLAPPLGGEQHT